MFVYFMATNSYTKIGITNSLKSRIKQVQTGCPIMIFKVNYIEVENREKALEIEKHFHKKLNHLNTYGEWFYTTNQPFYNNILQILELFNYSENDINTYFDYSESKKNDISNSMINGLKELRSENNTYQYKIGIVNKYINRIKSNSKDIYIAYSKEYILHQCNIEINRYIKLIKESEDTINTEINKKIKNICMQNESELIYQQKQLNETMLLIQEKEKNNDFIGILNLKKEIKKNKPSKIKNLKKIKKQVDNIYLKYGL